MTKELDLSLLHKALDEMERMYAFATSENTRNNGELFDYMRTAVVKGFEYGYEMSYKSLRRFLDVYGPAVQDTAAEYSFNDLLRLGEEYKVIDDRRAWMRFRDMRNMTSHAYQKPKADAVFAIVPDFARHARFLLSQMEQRLKGVS